MKFSSAGVRQSNGQRHEKDRRNECQWQYIYIYILGIRKAELCKALTYSCSSICRKEGLIHYWRLSLTASVGLQLSTNEE
jgi:hypothetical protein